MLAEAENPELLLTWEAFKNIMNDQFIKDATENGVKSWEKILKATPKGSDKLDDRKFRILTRLNEKLPYTYMKLKEQLTVLCGEEGYSIRLLNDEYILVVRVALKAKSNFEDVKGLLQRTVPANMIVDLSLLFNQHSELGKYANTRLSSFTHEQLRNEAIN